MGENNDAAHAIKRKYLRKYSLETREMVQASRLSKSNMKKKHLWLRQRNGTGAETYTPSQSLCDPNPTQFSLAQYRAFLQVS